MTTIDPSDIPAPPRRRAASHRRRQFTIVGGIAIIVALMAWPTHLLLQRILPCTIDYSTIGRCVADPVLTEVIAAGVGKDPSDRLTSADIAATTAIDTRKAPQVVTSLDGIEHFTALTSLIVDGTPREDTDGDGDADLPQSADSQESGEDPATPRPLESIPDLSALENLKTLDLSHNSISRIEGVYGLRQLETLRLADNEISAIRRIGPLHSLKSLDLSHNLITRVEGLKTLKNLQELNLSHNRIVDVSTADLKALEHLGEGDADNLGADAGLGSQKINDRTVLINGSREFTMRIPTIDGTPVTIDPFRGGKIPEAAGDYTLGDKEIRLHADKPGWYVDTGDGLQVPTGGKPLSYSSAVSAPFLRTAVTIDPKGGGDVEKIPAAIGVPLIEPAKPFKLGHDFTGWIEADGGPADFSKPVTGSTTISAHWKPSFVDEYTVSFDADGGSFTAPVLVQDGDRAEKPKDPTRKGRIFLGWTTTDGKEFDFTTPITKDTALIAGWGEPPKTATEEPQPQDQGGDWRLSRLRDAVKDPNADCKVVVVGSSTANGGVVTHREQGWSHRIGYAFAGSVIDLDTATDFGPGKKWYHGAVGGTTSGNYLPDSRIGMIAQIQPAYVIHMVGSNDWAGDVDPAKYQTNLAEKANAIEASVPGVVQIFIHQQPRADFDASKKKYAWSSYGLAAESVAAANPDQRVFLDINPALPNYDPSDAWSPGALVAEDHIHLNDQGNRLVTEFIAAFLGIPVTTGTAGQTETKALEFGGTVSLDQPGSSGNVSETVIPAAPYPRNIRISATLPTRPSGDAQLQLIVDNRTGEGFNQFGLGHQNASATDTVTGDWIYVPPGREITAVVRLAVNSGSAQATGERPYAWGHAEMAAI